MPTITRTVLHDQLMQRRGASAVTITAKTEPKMRKRLDGQANPFDVRKIAEVNGMINWRYANAVNNQRVREDQPLDDDGQVEFFEALPRKWGVRIQREDGTITPLVEHKGRFYLELKVEKSLRYEYQNDQGEVVSKELIQPWLYAQSKSKRQKTEKEILLRDYALDSIVQIRIDGEIFTITD